MAVRGSLHPTDGYTTGEPSGSSTCACYHRSMLYYYNIVFYLCYSPDGGTVLIVLGYYQHQYIGDGGVRASGPVPPKLVSILFFLLHCLSGATGNPKRNHNINNIIARIMRIRWF